MRIVGGKHRGRRLRSPDDDSIRPTADRIRESIFNILVHSDWGPNGSPPINEAIVLDAFCGTGALGLEALSHGAASAFFLDASARSLSLCGKNIASLNEEARGSLIKADATRPPPAVASCSLVFLDPPYGKDLIGRALTALAGRRWIADAAVCVAEMAAGAVEALPESFALLDERRYGQTAILFCRYQEGK